MAVLVWNPKWETGYSQIDDQHRELFRRLDRLMEAVPSGDPEAIALDFLPYLMTYVDKHFQDEEALMAAAGYSLLDAHRALHLAMREEATQMLERVALEGLQAMGPVLEWLLAWLVHHIDVEDRRLANHLQLAAQKQAKGTP